MNPNPFEIGALYGVKAKALANFKDKWIDVLGFVAQDYLSEPQARNIEWLIASGEAILQYTKDLKSAMAAHPFAVKNLLNDENYVREKLAWLYPIQSKPVRGDF